MKREKASPWKEVKKGKRKRKWEMRRRARRDAGVEIKGYEGRGRKRTICRKVISPLFAFRRKWEKGEKGAGGGQREGGREVQREREMKKIK